MSARQSAESARQREVIQMARMSHAACTHPSTKVARAACRRAMKKAAKVEIPNPILDAVAAAMNGPKMLMPAPRRVHVSVNALVLRRDKIGRASCRERVCQ